MRRRDLFTGLWKRVEERAAELQPKRSAEDEREAKRKRVSERLDAGGTFQLPRYNQQPEADDEP